MDNKVYIVHGSAIVQQGLSEVLLKNFKCTIQCYYDFKSLSESDDNCASKSIIFVEDKIANSTEFLQFIDQSHEVKSFSIVNDCAGNLPVNNDYTLSLYNSPDEIYERIKHAFNTQGLADEESEGLSNRELDVLKLVALGYANKEIAEKLFISTHTVMSHRKNITEKLGIKSISGLTVYAIINNYIDTTNLDIKDLI